jgi:hypothetical protein
MLACPDEGRRMECRSPRNLCCPLFAALFLRSVATASARKIERANGQSNPLTRSQANASLSLYLSWQTRFNDFAQNVQDELVRFLDTRGRIALNDQIDVCNSRCRSAVATQQRDRL